MLRKLSIATAGLLTLSAMSISYLWKHGDIQLRTQLQEAADGITDACYGLRESSSHYEQAKRNALMAYASSLSLSQGSGRDRNLFFRSLLDGSSVNSFARAAGSFAEALEFCEGTLEEPEASRDRVNGRTSSAQVQSITEALPDHAHGQESSNAEIMDLRDSLERFRVIDEELVSRSAEALRAATRIRAATLSSVSRLNAEIGRRHHVALLLQLAATVVLVAKDLAG
jgi:hypothetical protein